MITGWYLLNFHFLTLLIFVQRTATPSDSHHFVTEIILVEIFFSPFFFNFQCLKKEGSRKRGKMQEKKETELPTCSHTASPSSKENP